jgi:hypothetical protein
MPDKPPRKSETEACHVQNHVDNLENDLQESKSHILELQEANSSFNTSFNNLKEKHRKAIKSHAVQAVKSAADALMIKGLRNEIEKMKKASKDDRDKHKSEIKDMKVLHKSVQKQYYQAQARVEIQANIDNARKVELKERQNKEEQDRKAKAAKARLQQTLENQRAKDDHK